MDALKRIDELTAEEMRTMLRSLKSDLERRTFDFEEDICDHMESTFELFGVKIEHE